MTSTAFPALVACRQKVLGMNRTTAFLVSMGLFFATSASAGVPRRTPAREAFIAQSLEAIRTGDVKAWDARMRPIADLKQRCTRAGDPASWMKERIQRRQNPNWSPVHAGPCVKLRSSKPLRTVLWLDGGESDPFADVTISDCRDYIALPDFRVVVENEKKQRFEVVLTAMLDDKTGNILAGFHGECEEARPFVVACAILARRHQEPGLPVQTLISRRCEYELKREEPGRAKRKATCLEAAKTKAAANKCWGKPVL